MAMTLDSPSGVNRAIVKAHEQGILTSTSLMVTGEAVDQAVALAEAHPRLAVELHLVLVCGRAVLPPARFPTELTQLVSFCSTQLELGYAISLIRRHVGNCGYKSGLSWKSSAPVDCNSLVLTVICICICTR